MKEIDCRKIIRRGGKDKVKDEEKEVNKGEIEMKKQFMIKDIRMIGKDSRIIREKKDMKDIDNGKGEMIMNEIRLDDKIKKKGKKIERK